MKLAAQQHHEVIRSQNVTQNNFTIKATGHAFRILSDGLYSDKPGAIIRELCCNAYDAHVAAGRKAIPIEVQVPTVFEPVLIVRDFGIGLSDFDIRGGEVNGEYVPGLYTSFFHSTKTDSNDFIGALGLGSKSPFSYTNMFTVESCFDGVKSVYSMYLSEDGCPQVSLLSAGEYNGCNGITITIPVNADDISKFEYAIREQLIHFDPVPTFINKQIKIDKIEYLIQKDKWGVRSAGGYSSSYVVQGFVRYPIDSHQLSNNIDDESLVALAQMPLDLFVDLGSISFTPSREHLQYDKQTIAHLTKALTEIQQTFRGEIQQQFNQCGTYWDACLMLSDFLKRRNGYSSYPKYHIASMVIALHKNESFTWTDPENGLQYPLEHQLQFDGQLFNFDHKDKTYSIKSGSFHSRREQLKRTRFSVDRHTDEWLLDVVNIPLIIDDVGNKCNYSVRKFLETEAGGAYGFLFPIQKPSQQQIAWLKNQVEELFMGMPYVLTSQLVAKYPRPARVANVPVVARAVDDDEEDGDPATRQDNDLLVWVGKAGNPNAFRSYFQMRMWERHTNVDLEKGGLYIPVTRWSVDDERVDSETAKKFGGFINSAIRVGILPVDVIVYGINSAAQAKIDKLGVGDKWVNVIDYVEANTDKAEPLIDILAIEESDLRGWMRTMFNAKNVDESQIKDDVVSNRLKQYRAMIDINHDSRYCNWGVNDNMFILLNQYQLPNLASLHTKYQLSYRKWIDDLKQTVSKYSLMSGLSMYDLDDRWPAIIEYLNLVHCYR